MNKREIIVVGAGPVGLTAALALRSLGRSVTVVEQGAIDRLRPGSRAIFIHKESLKLLEQIQPGLGYACNARGLIWQTKRTLYRGRDVYHRTYPLPPSDRLPTATSLPQSVTEQMLLKACHDAGVSFLWSTPVTGVRVENDTVVVASAHGEPMSARYLIAADGARSAVRASVGIELEGARTSNAFVIVDVAEDPDHSLPVERVFHYEDPAVAGRNVLLVPFAGHWRVDLQCLPTDEPDALSSPAGVRAWLPRVMPARYAERVTWISKYVFRQAVASRFIDPERRILLVGEAAHVFAPFGARGLNSGMPDAYVAATAVHRALDTPADAWTAIDHFASARRAAALRNRAASSVALSNIMAPSPRQRLARRLAGAAARWWPKAGKWLDAAPYGPRLGPRDADGMRY